MSHRGFSAKVLAIMLVVAVSWVFVPPIGARESATLAGNIYALDGRQPVDGAVLHAGDIRTGEIYSSAATDSEGGFVLPGLPPAAYNLAIETDGGLYLVGTSMQLKAGEQRGVQLALKPDEGAADDPESASEEDDDDEMGFMNNPLFAALTVIGASILFGGLISALDDDDEGVASPFTN